MFCVGHAVAQLVQAMRYKPECRGFDFRFCRWNFPLPQSFQPHYISLGSTQPLTEVSTRYITWGVKAAGRRADRSYYLHVSIVLDSARLKLLEPSGPVQACNGVVLPYI